MLKKRITFMDYNETQRTEDFYFNLTQAEISEMELGTSGGFTDYVKEIIAAKDNATLVRLFKDLILRSYGKKSLDGRTFAKSEAIAAEFSHTEAYSILFMELAADANAASIFINGIIPASAREAVAAAEKAEAAKLAAIAPITTIS